MSETLSRQDPTTDRLDWVEMPFRGHVLRSGVLAFVVLVAVLSVIGWTIVGPLDDSVGDFDRRIAVELEQSRTETLDTVTEYLSLSADSLVKIPAVIILGGLFLWRFRRWTDTALLAGALALESSSFVIASLIVGRSRPAVVQLDTAAPTGSFPSGHVAAAVAFYGALAIIVWWNVRNRVVRGLAVTVAVVMPPLVAYSRLYRGMHYLTDAVFGLMLGVASLVFVWRLLADSRQKDLAEPSG